jgi:hypothetical protein
MELQEIHAWDGSNYTVYRSGETALSSSLPGFSLPVDDVFDI